MRYEVIDFRQYNYRRMARSPRMRMWINCLVATYLLIETLIMPENFEVDCCFYSNDYSEKGLFVLADCMILDLLSAEHKE